MSGHLRSVGGGAGGRAGGAAGPGVTRFGRPLGGALGGAGAGAGAGGGGGGSAGGGGAGGGAGASFWCAACGELAAIGYLRAGPTPRGAEAVVTVAEPLCPPLGPPLGPPWLNYPGGEARTGHDLSAALRTQDPDVYDAVRSILSGDAPDPAALRSLEPELAPFFCSCCERNYCRQHWHATSPLVLVRDGSYAGSGGVCPAGHPRPARAGRRR